MFAFLPCQYLLFDIVPYMTLIFLHFANFKREFANNEIKVDEVFEPTVQTKSIVDPDRAQNEVDDTDGIDDVDEDSNTGKLIMDVYSVSADNVPIYSRTSIRSNLLA